MSQDGFSRGYVPPFKECSISFLDEVERFRYCPFLVDIPLEEFVQDENVTLARDTRAYLADTFNRQPNRPDPLVVFTAKYKADRFKSAILNLVTDVFPLIRPTTTLAINLPFEFRYTPFCVSVRDCKKRDRYATLKGTIDIITYLGNDTIPTCLHVVPTVLDDDLLEYDLTLNCYYRYMKQKTGVNFKVGILAVKPGVIKTISKFKLDIDTVLSNYVLAKTHEIYIPPHPDRCFYCRYRQTCTRSIHETHIDNVRSSSVRYRIRERWETCGYSSRGNL